MNYNSYITGCNRGDFQWECVEYCSDGGVYIEDVSYKNKKCGATITKESNNEYLVMIDLKEEPFYIECYRSSRNNARKLVERIIMNDINGNHDKNIVIAAKEDNR